MTVPPANPKIYHITHLQNLTSILTAGSISSDARRIRLGMANTNVGMTAIKQRRLGLEVDCQPGTKVGEYVPFYFCPRSIMLYLIFKANHLDLSYTGGQNPIVHLQYDLNSVVQWAGANNCRWAFSPSNAGAIYTSFFKDINQLDEVDWDAVSSHNFQASSIKEGKQAEFLLFDQCPWTLIDEIGVIDDATAIVVNAIIGQAGHQPVVSTRPGWYY